jgi:hypothetical protein
VLIDALGRRFGDATDLRFTDANRRALGEVLADGDQLFIESVFLDDRERAAEVGTEVRAAWSGG